MKKLFRCMQFIFVSVLMALPNWVVAQTSPPLLSYATSGSEHVRSYNAAAGWTEVIRSYTGRFDLLTSTDARLTKVYPDGSTLVRDIIMQWVVDPNAPAQAGNAVEVPDPNNPLIERTTYVLALKFDGVRYSMNASFTTRAYFSVIPGIYDWFNVAYGDFAGIGVSPLGNYSISGAEKSGKTTLSYTGTLSLISPTSAQLTRLYANGSTTTVDLVMQTPIDLQSLMQTLSAAQVQNSNNQVTTYSLTLQLSGNDYAVNCSYSTTQMKGKSVKESGGGIFLGNQSY